MGEDTMDSMKQVDKSQPSRGVIDVVLFILGLVAWFALDAAVMPFWHGNGTARIVVTGIISGLIFGVIEAIRKNR